MKKLFLILSLINAPLIAQPESRRIVTCDIQYAIDMEAILKQFAGFTKKNTLKEYQDFMIRVKQFIDIGYFSIRPFERSITSNVRAMLRTPMQRYNDCRTAIGSAIGIGSTRPFPSKAILTPCEQTYALEMEAIVKKYTPIVNPQTLEAYKSFMIMLKQYEDTRFKISDFEKKTPNEIVYKLRLPMRQYSFCKDRLTIRAIS